jgi:hypothetical protein
MFVRYKRQYQRQPSIVKRIDDMKDDVYAQLLIFAENLKIDINEQVTNAEGGGGWGDESVESPAGGRLHIGYAYDDNFTKDEFERIVTPLMGNNLRYDDYKHIQTITDDDSLGSIVYPILDVLDKARRALHTDEVSVDKVVVNGGMSKLYLVKQRLAKFFGFEPIVALDPDQAVARGAAVYHYYLHKYGESDLAMQVGVSDAQNIPQPTSVAKRPSAVGAAQPANAFGIKLGKMVLNDALYLGMSAGSHELLIDAGAELPFQSPLLSGFSIAPKQSKIKIPIRNRNVKGEFTTIAVGEIDFERIYKEGAEVSIRFTLSVDKILDIEARTAVEGGRTTILIDKGDSQAGGALVTPKQGSQLIPMNEVSRLRDLCRERRKSSNKGQYRHHLKRYVLNISHCANPADFAVPIIREIEEYYMHHSRDEFFIQRLLVIARKIHQTWTPEQNAKIARLCNELIGALHNQYIVLAGERVVTCAEAIKTFGLLAEQKDAATLKNFHNADKRYRDAFIYAHAVSQTEIDWLYRQLDDASNQPSIWGIGVALKRNGKATTSKIDGRSVVEKLLGMLESNKLNANEQSSALLSVALICDQREDAVRPLAKPFAEEAYRRMETTALNYEPTRALDIARQMISGQTLSPEDEKYLLQRISDIAEEE